jgi:hypothetical protein
VQKIAGNELKEQVEKLIKERDEYRKLFELVSLELKRFKALLFGKKSEKVPCE